MCITTTAKDIGRSSGKACGLLPRLTQVSMSREQRLSLAIVLISACMADGTVH
jgi:hypothetical protein